MTELGRLIFAVAYWGRYSWNKSASDYRVAMTAWLLDFDPWMEDWDRKPRGGDHPS